MNECWLRITPPLQSTRRELGVVNGKADGADLLLDVHNVALTCRRDMYKWFIHSVAQRPSVSRIRREVGEALQGEILRVVCCGRVRVLS